MMGWAAMALAPLAFAAYLRQTSRELVGQLVKRLLYGLIGVSPLESVPPAKPVDPSPPPLTVHGEIGPPSPSSFFLHAPPLPGLPPSMALPTSGQITAPEAAASPSPLIWKSCLKVGERREAFRGRSAFWIKSTKVNLSFP